MVSCFALPVPARSAEWWRNSSPVAATMDRTTVSGIVCASIELVGWEGLLQLPLRQAVLAMEDRTLGGVDVWRNLWTHGQSCRQNT